MHTEIAPKSLRPTGSCRNGEMLYARLQPGSDGTAHLSLYLVEPGNICRQLDCDPRTGRWHALPITPGLRVADLRARNYRRLGVLRVDGSDRLVSMPLRMAWRAS